MLLYSLRAISKDFKCFLMFLKTIFYHCGCFTGKVVHVSSYHHSRSETLSTFLNYIHVFLILLGKLRIVENLFRIHTHVAYSVVGNEILTYA